MFVEEYSNIINKKLDVLFQKGIMALWGAGEGAIKLFQHTNCSGYDISYVIDQKLYGTWFFGKMVTKPDLVPWKNIDVVVISVFLGIDEIKEELRVKYGFEGDIFAIHDELPVPFYKLVMKKNIIPAEKDIAVLQRNHIYENCHAGEQVFILCTGPSISKLDLTKLQHEKTIAVNSFYLHTNCQLISPSYYCVPKVEDFPDWDSMAIFFREIQQVTQKAHYFFDIDDKKYIEKIREYENRCVNYISFSNIPNYENGDIDLTGLLMRPQSSSIMALELALYMGFKTIYLLGTEHDSLITKQYTHFYAYYDSIESKLNPIENASGELYEAFHLQLECIYKLWEQYKIIKVIAERKGIKIYNATPGGILDVFERIDFNKII